MKALTIPDEQTIGFASQYTQEQITALRGEIHGVRKAADLEYIHRMRVASRRLRSAAGYFLNTLPPGLQKPWKGEIRQVTRSLGQARDLDIQLQTLRRFFLVRDRRDQLPEFELLYRELMNRRDIAQMDVNATADQLETDPILESVAGFSSTNAPEEAVKTGSTPLKLLMITGIREKLRLFLQYEPYIHDPQNILELHAMRIAAKHLRYSMEIFSPLDRDGFKTWLRPVKQVQELLGNIHDCDVWEQTLNNTPGVAAQGGPGEPVDGILAIFRENRRNIRQQLYRQFLQQWEAGVKQGTWLALEKHLDSRWPAKKTVAYAVIARNTTAEVNDENRVDQ